MDLKTIKKLNIPKVPGCYKYFNKKGKIIYIGKASDLRSRVSSYWRKSANHTPIKQAMMKEIVKVEWIETDTEIEALLLESNLIKKHQPEYNIDLRDDKRFSYIKVSLGDEIPGIFITRTIDKSGKYFGPFTSAGALRETLKVIRKIWPFCTERKIKKKACFYSQIGRCTGVCDGRFDLKEYKEKILKPIILFLSGKKGKIIRKYELQIKKLALRLGSGSAKKKSREDEIKEELGILKQRLAKMKYVLEHAKIISLGEKYASDVIELAKILNLPKVPERIEGYDISNILGREAVGSMVVFSQGEPNKKEYRKFRIKFTDDFAGDVWMLKEVLERRIKRITHNAQRITKKDDNQKKGKWLNPDLMIIDGGKAQLNVALRVIKKSKLEIPVISVSKGKGLRSAQAPDKIFFPGERKPLELPLASPALHIIKRVRDEAHRFAIKYHRELRSKKWIKK